MRKPRLVIAGAGSSAGKTTIVTMLAMALRARGLKVQCFKCGPDYLDPTWHKKASGRESQNLDSWMMGRDAVLDTFIQASADADIALIEGVMGLFDGADATNNGGSTAEIARILDAPVICVLDAKGVARTLLPLYLGLKAFDPELKVQGLLANRVGSRGHLDLLAKACGDEMLGGLPKAPELVIAERHLGLYAALDEQWDEQRTAAWLALAEQWLSIDRLLALAHSAPELSGSSQEKPLAKPPVRCRIAVAFDEAFHFYYNHNFTLLEQAGAELVFFSPLHDPELPHDIDALIIGGGYPELHAEALAAAVSMRSSVQDFVLRGGTVFAECGGLMYLCRSLRTLDGCEYPMLGFLPAQAVMQDKIQALGYTEVEQEQETFLGPAGMRFRAHQFRYSNLVFESSVPTVWRLRSKRQKSVIQEGYAQGRILASYAHGHWASHPGIAQNFVNNIIKTKSYTALS